MNPVATDDNERRRSNVRVGIFIVVVMVTDVSSKLDKRILAPEPQNTNQIGSSIFRHKKQVLLVVDGDTSAFRSTSERTMRKRNPIRSTLERYDLVDLHGKKRGLSNHDPGSHVHVHTRLDLPGTTIP